MERRIYPIELISSVLVGVRGFATFWLSVSFENRHSHADVTAKSGYNRLK